jgi:hypothetical protein
LVLRRFVALALTRPIGSIALLDGDNRKRRRGGIGAVFRERWLSGRAQRAAPNPWVKRRRPVFGKSIAVVIRDAFPVLKHARSTVLQ